MTHLITKNCCNDATCVSVCPVNCIHPTPYEPDYATAEMLYVDPEACIDCGACAMACPVGAAKPDYDLPDAEQPFLELNEAYFADPSHREYEPIPFRKRSTVDITQTGPLRVAVVGSGPAAWYAVEELTTRRGLDIEVNVFERLQMPWGLIRYGVAPDHPETKTMAEVFQRTAQRSNVRLRLNVEVGNTISTSELLQYHHAVVYAGGASNDRRLELPGEDLPGSHAGADFVAWYNGHPEAAQLSFDLTSERAVIVGNGNVALDIARVLATPIDTLAKTDISEHALEALAQSRIREIVILGRRGSAQAAFSLPELLSLKADPSFNLIADTMPLPVGDTAGSTSQWSHSLAAMKSRFFAELPRVAAAPDRRTIKFQFLTTPVAFVGTERVRAIRVARNRLVSAGGEVRAEMSSEQAELECGLVLRATGYRGAAVPGFPFDEGAGIIPNNGGRVVTPASPEGGAGLYVAGWIKRGATGGIGANRACAEETVETLLTDFAHGRLRCPSLNGEALDNLIIERRPDVLELADWLTMSTSRRHEQAESLAGGLY